MSEAALLARILPRLPRGATTIIGPGDDAAVLAPPTAPMVVTTDVLVQDRHFRLDWGTGADVGWRAAMQNLADVAAMGAEPTSIVVALVLPAEVPVAWVEDLSDGLAQACAPHQVGVVGGDLTSGRQICIAVTAHGVMADGEPVLRSGAQPGDVVALSGTLGRSAAGAALLAAGHRQPADLIETFLRPTPPLHDGPVALRAGAHGLMDVSDGLVLDAGRMAQASGVVIDLDPVALAADVAALRSAADVLTARVAEGAVPGADTDAEPGAGADADARNWVLGGGEDHALLATFPGTAGEREAAPSSALPGHYRRIGHVLPVPPGQQPGVRWGGRQVPSGVSGWDHFSG